MIVVDTHVWLWWASDPSRLSRPAQQALDAAARVGVPAIACLEVATLADRGRIRLRSPIREWVGRALAHERVDELPVTAAVALEAGLLDRGSFPGDPVDRIVYATARAANAPLLTADRGIREFDPVRAVW